MRALVLWAEPHSTNLGVQALGQGTAALADRVWPGVEVRFQGYGPGDGPLRIGNPKTLAKHALMRHSVLRDWVTSFDVVIDTRAGDSFADIYGLRRLTAMSAMAEFVRRAGVPLVMGPQTVGPFDTRRGSWIGRRNLHTATTVMVRDTTSAAFARRLGREPDVVTTDVVFALPVPTPPRSRDVIVNVSGLLWNPNPHVDSVAYRATVAGLCGELAAAGRQVSLLAHVLDSPLVDNDVPAARALAVELGADLEVVVPESLAHVREIIASGQVVIGSRMHACLNALSVGVPAVPLAYSRKFQPLLDDLGWAHTVDLRTDDKQVERVLDALDASDLAEQVASVAARAADRLGAAEQALRAAV